LAPRKSEAGLAQIRQAYYAELWRAPRFPSDLKALYKQIARTTSAPLDERDPEKFFASRLKALTAQRETLEPTIQAFIERWHLPKRYAIDLRLYLVDHPTTTDLGLRAEDFLTTVPRGLPAICATVGPIAYNPSDNPKGVLDRLVEHVRDDLASQLEHARAQAIKQGWRPRGPRLTPGHVETIARRLYQRAVLGLPWKEIARREGPGVTAHTVEVSVRDWARALGISLPRHRPGRPPKSKERMIR
jgi:hypothetical protein